MFAADEHAVKICEQFFIRYAWVFANFNFFRLAVREKNVQDFYEF